MKVFHVRLTGEFPNPNQPIQIVCEDRAASRLATILNNSTSVVAFNADGGGLSPVAFEKEQANLFQKELEERILQAVIASNGMEGSCKRKNWVGAPGDYSPPDCNCPECVTAGLGWIYNTVPELTPELWLHFVDAMRSESFGTKNYRWGYEYKVPSLTVSMFNQGTGFIRCNTPIRTLWGYEYDCASRKFTKLEGTE